MAARRKNPPVVLSIAGSDNSCGAGLQADLKTITSLGGYGQTAVTCVVAEVPGRVSSIQAMRVPIVLDQVRLSLEAFPVAAIKTGMLHSAPVIEGVAAMLAKHARSIPLVVDPVMVASSGDPLLRPNAITAYKQHLFPRAALVTPNLDELSVLCGRRVESVAEMRDAGARLVAEYGVPFLVKGGHLRTREAIDLLVTPSGITTFSAPFLKNAETHGTGCTLSAAVATGLARGLPLEDAVAEAKGFLTEALRRAIRWPLATALDHRL